MANLEEFDIKSFLDSLENNHSNEYKASITEYYQSISHLADGDLDLEFNNKDEVHGALVMSLLFKHAKNEDSINIFTGRLNGELCDKKPYFDNLREAILRNIPINIIFEKSPNKETNCFNMLQSMQAIGHNIKMYKLNPNFKDTYKIKGELSHFTVIADKYRLEHDTVKFQAVCNFDDKNLSKVLHFNFSELIKNSSILCLSKGNN